MELDPFHRRRSHSLNWRCVPPVLLLKKVGVLSKQAQRFLDTDTLAWDNIHRTLWHLREKSKFWVPGRYGCKAEAKGEEFPGGECIFALIDPRLFYHAVGGSTIEWSVANGGLANGLHHDTQRPTGRAGSQRQIEVASCDRRPDGSSGVTTVGTAIPDNSRRDLCQRKALRAVRPNFRSRYTPAWASCRRVPPQLIPLLPSGRSVVRREQQVVGRRPEVGWAAPRLLAATVGGSHALPILVAQKCVRATGCEEDPPAVGKESGNGEAGVRDRAAPRPTDLDLEEVQVSIPAGTEDGELAGEALKLGGGHLAIGECKWIRQTWVIGKTNQTI
ncbi:hypothetical protein H6P81_021721 [Aristolochia fimbriata]|uniref:Uncharacterized protein n=1 Tax=Aristolochia fimbriata TaxID=158543 RepID=A0AAV7DP60_ARIFI|nr:hypothetical protein H6P81_021721 [Aristolochia fimbriata]